jgi:hypothetical protein
MANGAAPWTSGMWSLVPNQSEQRTAGRRGASLPFVKNRFCFSLALPGAVADLVFR